MYLLNLKENLKMIFLFEIYKQFNFFSIYVDIQILMFMFLGFYGDLGYKFTWKRIMQ